jgi:hypothetical protein
MPAKSAKRLRAAISQLEPVTRGDGLSRPDKNAKQANPDIPLISMGIAPPHPVNRQALFRRLIQGAHSTLSSR